MNSIFSSFDAVCAEFLGHSVKASLPSSIWNKCDGRLNSQQPNTEINNTTENNSAIKEHNSSSSSLPPSPSPAVACARSKKQLHKKAARFAPNLDGLNCFETLVSY